MTKIFNKVSRFWRAMNMSAQWTNKSRPPRFNNSPFHICIPIACWQQIAQRGEIYATSLRINCTHLQCVHMLKYTFCYYNKLPYACHEILIETFNLFHDEPQSNLLDMPYCLPEALWYSEWSFVMFSYANLYWTRCPQQKQLELLCTV
jgi:hypothetical protein